MNKELAAAFIAAKKKFAPALKASTNPHFKSKYADLAACIEAVDDAFLESGICMYQETMECQDGIIIETILLHESGDGLRCGKLFVPAPKKDPQGFGSALTYARRYSLMAAVGIAPEDDDGNAASKKAPNPPTTSPRDVARQKLIQLCSACTSGLSPEAKKTWVKAIFEVDSLKEVLNQSEENINSFIKKLEVLAKEKAEFESTNQ